MFHQKLHIHHMAKACSMNASPKNIRHQHVFYIYINVYVNMYTVIYVSLRKQLGCLQNLLPWFPFWQVHLVDHSYTKAMAQKMMPKQEARGLFFLKPKFTETVLFNYSSSSPANHLTKQNRAPELHLFLSIQELWIILSIGVRARYPTQQLMLSKCSAGTA